MTMASNPIPTTPAGAPPTRTSGTAPAGAAAPAASRRVNDAPVRAFHWLFAACFAIAYASGDSERLRLVHATAGYAMLGLLAFRVAYGVLGPRPARLAAAWSRARSAFAADPPGLPLLSRLRRRTQGLGAAATLALLALTVPLAVSGLATLEGWLPGLAADLVEEAHEALGSGLLAIAAVHVGLLAVASGLSGRNAARPMLDGRIAGAGPDAVRSDRRALAALLVVAVLGFAGWHLASGSPGAADPPATQWRTSR